MSYSSQTTELHPDDDSQRAIAPEGTEAAQESKAQEGETQDEAQEGTAPKGATSWEQRRINTLTRQKHEAERRAALAEQAAEHFRRAKEAPAGEAPEGEAQVAALKEQFSSAVDAAAAKRQFDAECTQIYNAGMGELQGFDARLRNFSQVGGLNPVLIEAVMESASGPGAPKAHRILHELGGNLDEAARILELPPVRMAAAVAKFAASLREEGKRVTSAPAPIKPITPAASSAEKDPEKMSPQEWRVWREEQIAAKRKGR